MRQTLFIALTLLWLVCGVASQAGAEQIFVITRATELDGQSIFNFESANLGARGAQRSVTGLRSANEALVGIDFRPATGQLYGVSDLGRIYTINTASGAATFVSMMSTGALSTGLSGTSFGIDFNPTVDRLRLVSNTGQNLRVNVDTGEVNVDTPVAYAAGDTNAGQTPNITASAYTNSFAGATATTLFGIDTNLGVLVTQNPANAGTLQTVASLANPFANPFVAPLSPVSFDISGATGTAYTVLNARGSALYSFSLTTGESILIGSIGEPGRGPVIVGMAAQVGAAAPVPEPATMVLLSTGLAGVAASKIRQRRTTRRKR